jgi:hypothetical protein
MKANMIRILMDGDQIGITIRDTEGNEQFRTTQPDTMPHLFAERSNVLRMLGSLLLHGDKRVDEDGANITIWLGEDTGEDVLICDSCLTVSTPLNPVVKLAGTVVEQCDACWDRDLDVEFKRDLWGWDDDAPMSEPVPA